MPLPLLETVSKLIRGNWPFVQQGVGRGMSANAIIRALRVKGEAGRRTDLLKTIRYAKSQHEYGKRLQTLPSSIIPRKQDIPLAPHQIRRQYSYLIEIRGTDIATGKPITRHVTVTSNTLIPKGTASQIALDTIEDDEDRYGLEEATASVSNIMQAGPAGVF